MRTLSAAIEAEVRVGQLDLAGDVSFLHIPLLNRGVGEGITGDQVRIIISTFLWSCRTYTTRVLPFLASFG